MSTGSADDYTVNPARLIEKHVIGVVRRWVDAAGIVRDESAGGGRDFWIDYHDGRRAVGEIKADFDPEVQAMWGNTFDYPRPQIIDLAPGNGTWSLGLIRGASIKRLYKQLPLLVQQLRDAGRDRVGTLWVAPDDNLGARVRDLGIAHLARVSSTADVAVFFMPMGDATTPLHDDADSIVDWLDALLATAKYQNLAVALTKINGVAQRHIAVMSQSATTDPVERALREVGNARPTRDPQILDGITHIWAFPRWREPGRPSYAAFWTTDDGWLAIPE